MSNFKPYAVITEQPASKSQRFRYLSEVDGARSVGSIPGVSSTSERRTYPTIQVHGHKGPFLVLLSLLNPDNNLVHPHSITGSDPRYTCRNGVIFVISDEPEVIFKNIGILCVKGKTEGDVQSSLKLRKQINVDPFGAGFSHIKDHRRIDFTAVRLCFQVFLPGPDWTPADRLDLMKYSRSLAPVVSDVVYDAKKLNDLKIVHVTYCAGPMTGGTEMTLLCDKYTGQNPDVVFDDGHGWTQVATAKMHHKQLAIVFLAPPYREERNPDSPKVQVYLQQQQNNERGVLRSQPVTVEYLPNPPKGSAIQYPTQPPPNYPAHIYAKGKGKGKSTVKSSNTCAAMPRTPTQMPPLSPYQDIKMSPANYHQKPAAGNLEADFNAYNGPGQHVNITSSYRHLNFSNMNIQGLVSDINNMPTSNTRGNSVIPNTHAVVNTRMANLNLNPTLAHPSGVINEAPGSYKFSANFPSGTKIKRSVSEHNNSKPDSGELSPKREKVIPSSFKLHGCDTTPANVISDNPFLTSNGEIPTAAACSPPGVENVYNPTLFNDIMFDPHLGGILDEVVNILNAGQTWHDNIMASTTPDHNNVNLNPFNQDTISYNNYDYNNAAYNDVEQNVPINIAQNLPDILPNNGHFINYNMDDNLLLSNSDQQHNIPQIDYADVLELSEELNRIELSVNNNRV